MSKTIFIIHGRDDQAKDDLTQHLEGLGLNVIILHKEASRGMSIIEKIKRYVDKSDFAIALFTGCDLGRGHHEPETLGRNRARQNVVFEYAYAMAKFGRSKVLALVEPGVEIPNDMSGVVYVILDESGTWKEGISKELRAHGLCS